MVVSDGAADAAMRELSAGSLTIGELGAAPLEGLRALQGDDECHVLREHLEIDARTRVLQIATEGPTGAHTS